MENKMTAQQAIEILDRATNQLQLTRTEHGTIVQALQTLLEVIQAPVAEAAAPQAQLEVVDKK